MNSAEEAFRNAAFLHRNSIVGNNRSKLFWREYNDVYCNTGWANSGKQSFNCWHQRSPGACAARLIAPRSWLDKGNIHRGHYYQDRVSETRARVMATKGHHSYSDNTLNRFSSRPFSHPYKNVHPTDRCDSRMSLRSSDSARGGRNRIRDRSLRGKRNEDGAVSSNVQETIICSCSTANLASMQEDKPDAESENKPSSAGGVLDANNIYLQKFKRLAEKILGLKSKRPNSIDTIHSVANMVGINIQVEIECIQACNGAASNDVFCCLVKFDGVCVSIGRGGSKRASKNAAYDAALAKLNERFQRVVSFDGGTREFQAADAEFSADPPQQYVVKPEPVAASSAGSVVGDSGPESVTPEENTIDCLLSTNNECSDSEVQNPVSCVALCCHEWMDINTFCSY